MSNESRRPSQFLTPAWAGIDVACAKGKPIPICVCTEVDGVITPLPLVSAIGSYPVGSGNPAMLDADQRRQLATECRDFLHEVERQYDVRIEKIAIDAPRQPAGSKRRACELAMDALKIGCYPTPSREKFDQIIADGKAHLDAGGAVARLPSAFQLWMLLGFELFEVLMQDWECIEIFPHAIARTLGAVGTHKSTRTGQREQLGKIAGATGWSRELLAKNLAQSVRGESHDQLDAFMAAWIASLYPRHTVACGEPPADVIWLPDVEALQLDDAPANRAAAAVDAEFQSGRGKTTFIGYVNRNNQTCLGHRGKVANDSGQTIYKLQCGDCGVEYGAFASSVSRRKCPGCQRGAAGLDY